MATFKEWLSEQIDDGTDIGDLAKDAIADKGWTGSDPSSLEIRLSTISASSETWDALEVATELYNLYHCPCYIWKDHDKNDIHYHFQGKHYVGWMPIKWKHRGKWHYEDGQSSDPSYLKASTFTFETPDGDVEVSYFDIESRDWDFYDMISPT
jgi:hypothetical protein